MIGSAIGCGILLGVFEGVGVLVGRSVIPPVSTVVRRADMRCFPLQAVCGEQQAHLAFGASARSIFPYLRPDSVSTQLPEQTAPPPGQTPQLVGA